MTKVITFGETMMRLNPQGHLRLTQANLFEATYAGSEANVAVSLANYGDESAFVTKVPAHEIGQNAVNELRRYGVDTSLILRGGPRLGVYFVERGASQRGGKVIYDRAGSSIALAKAEEFDWPRIFEGADWFHFSGITPALGGDLPKACMEAAQTARRLGLTVSCDLNYRSKLWTREQAGRAMRELMPFVDVCVIAEDEAKDVFGIVPEAGLTGRDAVASVARQVRDAFGLKIVGIATLNETSSSDNVFSGLVCDGTSFSFAPEYAVHVVDRVGCGDSFSAGLIHALRKGWDLQKTADFATAAGCLKQSVEFDFNQVTEAEVLALASHPGAGGMQR